jgi:drug/metabolite transporter (DMT)-like permease
MHARRIVAVILVILGAVLMFLAPEVWAGVALLAAGVLVEVVGIALERNRHR